MNSKKILFTIITIIFILSSSGCEKSGSGGSDSSPEVTGSKLINENGGRVELESSGKKAAAIIPEKALLSPENISIKMRKSLPKSLPANSIQAGDCINFGPEGIIFKKNVVLGVPYNDENNDGLIDYKFVDVKDLKINYYDPIAAMWTIIPVKYLDRGANIAYFETNHFSNYISFVDKKDSIINTDLEIVENEYFTGSPYYYTEEGTKKLRIKGCINRPDLQCGEYWHLSIFMHHSAGIVSIVDRYFTKNHLSGYPVIISEDGASITFDAQEVFEKVKKTGDARLWDWQSEFVFEHTKLINYIVISDDDPDYVQSPENNRIYSQIKALDKNRVQISWKINIRPEIKPGKTLSIRFEARYKPNGI